MSRARASAGELIDDLRRRFGARCLTARAAVRLYGYDAMGTAFGVPAAVVQPVSADEIAQAVAICRRHGAVLVARGAGTGLSGGSVPPAGAVVLSLERLEEVGEPDVPHRRVRAQAGVVNGSLEQRLAPGGLFYPPDPASFRVSTIGGNVAENAGGPHAVKYGVTGHRVLALELVDALGRQGRLDAGPWQSGPDLAALVTGSEGTLAVVHAATLALAETPAATATLLLSFRSIEHASLAVSEIVAHGLLPATLEFLDRATVAAVEAWGVARYPEGSGAVLLVEFDGADEEVARGAARAQEIARSAGAIAAQLARSADERDALWLGRRGAYAAVARYGRRVLTQDVTVPRDRLAEMLRAVEEISARHGLHALTVGHAGDGNLHPDFAYDPDDPEESRRVHEANREVLAACVALGGSITGEHGIGTEKLGQLAQMLSPAELGLSWAVRRALNPEGLLNPGKAVPEAARAVPAPPPAAPPAGPLRGAADALAAVAWARRDGRPLRADLSALDSVEVRSANMTARVGPGARIEDLDRALAGTALGFACRPLLASTFGELLATNDYGPEEVSQGTLRRHLLAVEYVTGCGEHVLFGRETVKNVAGYDLGRLLIGSAGRLGVPISLALRLLPRSEAPWWVRRGPLFAAGDERGALSLFAAPDGNGFLVYRQSQEAPEGFRPAPDAPAVLAGAIGQARGAEDLLDIAVAWDGAPQVLSSLGGAPLLVLPSAGRILARVGADVARSIAAAVRGPCRARYGGEELPLRQDALAAAWQERLCAVFDPDGVLAGGGAR